MFEAQYRTELKYSKKHIKDVVLEEVNLESPIIKDLMKSIDEYRTGEYSYGSKCKRIQGLKTSSLKLAIDLTVIVLTIEAEVSPIQVVISQLISSMHYKNILDAVKTAAEIIAVCEGELYSLLHSSNEDNGTGTLSIKPNYEVSTNVRKFIDGTKYLPPMVCKPIPWKSNYEGGHLTGSGNVVLGSINHTPRKQNLNTINTLQKIAWSINTDVLEFVEESKKILDSSEKKANFLRLVETSEEVYSELLDQGNKFYFVWKYDFRGRSYSQGYHVNLQGNSYRKALIEFHNKELLTEGIVK